MRAFLARFVGLLLGLVLFLQTLDLLATANEVLAGGGAPLDSLVRYVMLRVPSLIETVAPLAGLLGALTALVTLAKNSEVLAMRAAGRSACTCRSPPITGVAMQHPHLHSLVDLAVCVFRNCGGAHQWHAGRLARYGFSNRWPSC